MATLIGLCLAFAVIVVPQSGTAPPKAVGQAPPLQAPALEPAPGNPVVRVSTSMGDVTLELFKDRAPVSVENFLQYVADGYYEGTIFHRVKQGFMVQGGGFTAEMVEKPTRPPIQNEATNGIRNTPRHAGDGPHARAPQRDVAVLHQRRRQRHARSPRLLAGRFRLRRVRPRALSGMEVIDKIAATPTGSKGDHEDVPVTPVVIKKVSVISA